MTHKACYVCREYLPLEQFHKHAGHIDGRMNKCKKCQHAYQQQHRLNIRHGSKKVQEINDLLLSWRRPPQAQG